METEIFISIICGVIIWNALLYLSQRNRRSFGFIPYKVIVLTAVSILLAVFAFISWYHQFDGAEGHGFSQRWLGALMLTASFLGLLHVGTAATANLKNRK